MLLVHTILKITNGILAGSIFYSYICHINLKIINQMKIIEMAGWKIGEHIDDGLEVNLSGGDYWILKTH